MPRRRPRRRSKSSAAAFVILGLVIAAAVVGVGVALTVNQAPGSSPRSIADSMLTAWHNGEGARVNRNFSGMYVHNPTDWEFLREETGAFGCQAVTYRIDHHSRRGDPLQKIISFWYIETPQGWLCYSMTAATNPQPTPPAEFLAAN